MRIAALSVLAVLAVASPAAAQFSAYYEGTQKVGDKTIPVATQFSVEPGRVAMVMKGEKTARILFVEKDGFLRIIDDAGKSYFDLDRAALKQQVGGAMEQMQKELAKLPPEKRAMAESMMKNAMGSAQPPPPTLYVWSKETQKVKGYTCTRVDVMEGEVKKAEYWGTPAADFKLKEPERATVLAMQSSLRDFMIQVAPAGGGHAADRAFQWDTSADGFPLISRCFNGDVMTLDLHLASFDRKPLAADLFTVPDGYTQQTMDLGQGHGRHRTR